MRKISSEEFYNAFQDGRDRIFTALLWAVPIIPKYGVVEGFRVRDTIYLQIGDVFFISSDPDIDFASFCWDNAGLVKIPEATFHKKGSNAAHYYNWKADKMEWTQIDQSVSVMEYKIHPMMRKDFKSFTQVITWDKDGNINVTYQGK